MFDTLARVVGVWVLVVGVWVWGEDVARCWHSSLCLRSRVVMSSSMATLTSTPPILPDMRNGHYTFGLST